MRIPRLTIATVLLLAAGPAFADDTAIPGLGRTGPQWQRSEADNPEMKPYMQAQPASAQVPAPASAASSTPAAPMLPVDTRHAVLQDAEQLLRHAEGEIAARDRQQASLDLQQARTALQNASAAGDAMPASAMRHLIVAQRDLHGGQFQAAVRATAGAERAIEAAR